MTDHVIAPAHASIPIYPKTPEVVLRRGALTLAALLGGSWLFALLFGLNWLPLVYLETQDTALLAGGAVGLVALGLLARYAGGAAPALSTRLLVGAGLAAAFAAYLGSWLVMQRYGVSRDEQLADFAASHFMRGQFGLRVPDDMRPVARAAQLWAESRLGAGSWVSSYLPVNSLFRALAGLAGDRWLAGPALLLLGLYGLWSATRRLWPDNGVASTVAIVLAITSTQLLANAMTAYAMTTLFALHACWIACFLRGGRLGHGAALFLGLLAGGAHQLHFYPLFAIGFVVWLWQTERRSLALLYAAGIIATFLFWHGIYKHVILDWAIGAATSSGDAARQPFGIDVVVSYLRRLGDLEPVTGMARFAAWQNVLLLPLAMVGAEHARDADGRPTIFSAMRLSCFIGILLIIYQGHGYGYRYLHSLIPCFLLLATHGWMTLAQRHRMSGAVLAGSAALALGFTAPLALSQAHAFVKPYRLAHDAIRAAPADVVLIDPDAGAFAQDLARLDGAPSTRPLVLDLAYVPLDWLAHTCATRTVMRFERPQAAALGMPDLLSSEDFEHRLKPAQRYLAATGCGRPVPLPQQ